MAIVMGAYRLTRLAQAKHYTGEWRKSANGANEAKAYSVQYLRYLHYIRHPSLPFHQRCARPQHFACQINSFEYASVINNAVFNNTVLNAAAFKDHGVT